MGGGDEVVAQWDGEESLIAQGALQDGKEESVIHLLRYVEVVEGISFQIEVEDSNAAVPVVLLQVVVGQLQFGDQRSGVEELLFEIGIFSLCLAEEFLKSVEAGFLGRFGVGELGGNVL